MTNIIIYTTPEKLLHKQDRLENDPDKSPNGIYYWELKGKTKEVQTLEKIYFATKGFIRGYFLIDHTYSDHPAGKTTIAWESNTWKDIKPTPQKPFQGFKYKK